MGKKKSRRRKQKYNPAETLRPTTLDPSLESVARDLYEKACCGTRQLWPDIDSDFAFKKDAALHKRFMSAAHEGMRSAQDFLIEQVQSSTRLSVSEELLYRGIADSIAWQFLGGQLCHARRLFKEQRQPDLKQCNFSSVVVAANSIVQNDPDAMPLISDLTSFVQVGDIISMAPGKGLSIIEVKEGAVNNRILDFLGFYRQSGCERALEYFLASEGPLVAKQMGRVLRQEERMSHVLEVMNTGASTDPDTSQKIKIPDEFIPVEDWDGELNQLIQNSEERGWALDVVEDCLFVACYSKGPMLHASNLAFNAWFDGCGGDETSPRARMLDSMQAPLALPIFSRQLPEEAKFDLLFGRKQICMGINVDALIKRCEDVGLRVRVGSNKETTEIEQAGVTPYRHKGKSIFIAKNDKEMALLDGIFMRALFHGQKPVSTIQTILST